MLPPPETAFVRLLVTEPIALVTPVTAPCSGLLPFEDVPPAAVVDPGLNLLPVAMRLGIRFGAVRFGGWVGAWLGGELFVDDAVWS